MFNFDINENAIITERKALEAALSTNPKTATALRKAIRKVIMEARDSVAAAARASMKDDPRGAAQAVRTVVYKKVLGANVNILNSRRAHGASHYAPPRKLDANPRQRGGNRRPRSMRTQQVMDYSALDRGFILRFVNAGTAGRQTRYGNRGSISARHFFRAAGERAVGQAADRLSALIDSELGNILNGKDG